METVADELEGRIADARRTVSMDNPVQERGCGEHPLTTTSSTPPAASRCRSEAAEHNSIGSFERAFADPVRGWPTLVYER